LWKVASCQYQKKVSAQSYKVPLLVQSCDPNGLADLSASDQIYVGTRISRMVWSKSRIAQCLSCHFQI
jgi:hypothetical protein